MPDPPRRNLTVVRALAARPPPGLRTVKITLAAVLAYVVAQRVTGTPGPLLAPLTALLVVQLTLYQTLTHGLRRVISVVTGVLIAVAFSLLVGLTWWSLGVMVLAALVLGELLRLGPQLLEVPISAMFVLAVGGQAQVATARVFETLIGAAVGVTVNAVLVPPVYMRPAGQAVRELADRIAGVLRGMAAAVRRDGSVDTARRELQRARRLDRDVARAERALDRLDESLRLNPLAARAGVAPVQLRAAVHSLEHTVIALRSVARVLTDRTAGGPAYEPETREALAAVLYHAAAATVAFGKLPDPGVPGGAGVDEVLGALRDAVADARRARGTLARRLTGESRAWELNGALLAGLDRLLTELDPGSGESAEQVVRPPRASRPAGRQRLAARTRAAARMGVRGTRAMRDLARRTRHR